MSPPAPRHIALQFGHIKHFNEGLAEVSRQLALQIASRAKALRQDRQWHFHFILPLRWHGMFGDEVRYHDVEEGMRLRHRFPVDVDVWHGLHQHMRYRPPANSRHNIVTVHDLNHVHAKQGLSLWWQNMRLLRQLRGVQRLVAISGYVAADIAQHLPRLPHATVIHNGVADLSAAPQAPVEGLGDGMEDKPFLLHISRMSPSKNVGALIEMMAAWPEKRLVLCGPRSPETQAHKAHAARLGLRNVQLVCDVSEAQKAWLYQHCEAFLFPSLMEGFGLPPIEAMYFGKPVIAARATCLPEICGDAAAYWDGFEPAAMRRVVEAWLRRHEADAGMAARARQQALRYTWPHAAGQYLDLYGREA